MGFYLQHLNNDDAYARQIAFTSIARINRRAALSYLLDALNDVSSFNRLAAVECLEGASGKKVTESLMTLLYDDDRDVRDAAGALLQKMNVSSWQMLEGYLKALRSANMNVRLDAAWKIHQSIERKLVQLTYTSYFVNLLKTSLENEPRKRTNRSATGIIIRWMWKYSFRLCIAYCLRLCAY